MRIRFRKEWVTPAIVGVASFAAGTGAGWFAHRKRLGDDPDKAVEAMQEVNSQLEIDFSREAIDREINIRTSPFREALDDKNERINELNREIQHLKEIARGEPEEAEQPNVEERVETKDGQARVVMESGKPKVISTKDGRRNMFETPEPRGVDAPFEFDDDERGPSAPYTISRVEFGTLKPEYEQVELRYFAGDDALVDPQGVPIYNVSEVVGGKLEFGRGSGDSNVVYVCNEKLRAKYEITRSETSYESYNMWLMAEDEAAVEDLRHSAKIPRFRQE